MPCLGYWDVNERVVLAPQAFAQTASRFPTIMMIIMVWLMRSTTQRKKNLPILAVQLPNVGSETGVVTSKEPEEEAKFEEQRLPPRLRMHCKALFWRWRHRLPSGKILFRDLLCHALVTISCVSDMSG